MDQKMFLAKLAEQAKRYEDTIQFMLEAMEYKEANNFEDDFTADERNLLSLAFKKLIESQRIAIRTIFAIEKDSKYKKYQEHLSAYKK